MRVGLRALGGRAVWPMAGGIWGWGAPPGRRGLRGDEHEIPLGYLWTGRANRRIQEREGPRAPRARSTHADCAIHRAALSLVACTQRRFRLRGRLQRVEVAATGGT